MTTTNAQKSLKLHKNRESRFDWNHFEPFPVREVDTKVFDALIEEWLHRLVCLRCSGEATPDMARSFAEFLVAHQRTADESRERVRCAGTWAIPEDVVMGDFDAYVDYMHVPTYIAIAVLSLVKQDYPEIADSIEGLEAALESGEKSASMRSLQGHGYESTQQSLVAIEYLAVGKVFTLRDDRGRSHRFSRVKYRSRKDIEKQIKNQQSSESNGWSAIDEDRGIIALGLLEGCDRFDSVVCRRPSIVSIRNKMKEKIEKEAVDELLRTLAVRMMPSVVDEISERRKEIDMKAEEIRPSCPKYRSINRQTICECSDNIKLNSTFCVSDVFEEVMSDEYYRDLCESEDFMDRFKNKITDSLHNYFNASDINGDDYHQKDTIVNVAACEMAGDQIVPLINVRAFRDC